MSDTVTHTLPAYAYEIAAGDKLGDREVAGVQRSGQTVTVTYAAGSPTTHQREDEVLLTRSWPALPEQA